MIVMRLRSTKFEAMSCQEVFCDSSDLIGCLPHAAGGASSLRRHRVVRESQGLCDCTLRKKIESGRGVEVLEILVRGREPDRTTDSMTINMTMTPQSVRASANTWTRDSRGWVDLCPGTNQPHLLAAHRTGD